MSWPRRALDVVPVVAVAVAVTVWFFVAVMWLRHADEC
jgi:hypothetical protein